MLTFSYWESCFLVKKSRHFMNYFIKYLKFENELKINYRCFVLMHLQSVTQNSSVKYLCPKSMKDAFYLHKDRTWIIWAVTLFLSYSWDFLFKTVVMRIAAEERGTSCEFVSWCLTYSYKWIFILFNSIEIFCCTRT